MYWILAVAVAIEGGIIGYLFLWLTSHDMAIEALREDRQALLRKIAGRTDGPPLSEILDKKRGSVQELIRSLGELEKYGDGERPC